MLRRLGPTLMCGCCCWLSGCQISQHTPSPPASAQPAAAPEKSANSIELYLAIVQVPLGHPFLNRDAPTADAAADRKGQPSSGDALPEGEGLVLTDGPARTRCLWSSTDQRVVSMEEQIVVEENGYRVGQIMGVLPAQMLTLLGSRQHCIDPRRRVLANGEASTVHLGPTLVRSTFEVRQSDQAQPITLEQARFCLEIQASLTKDGRTRLDFLPKVEHRPAAFAVERSPDGFVNKLTPPHKSFPQIGWHVLVKPGETLVIGASLDKPGTLGCRSFLQEDLADPVQRVLLLRTSRPLEDEE